jgi:hypothetical protein
MKRRVLSQALLRLSRKGVLAFLIPEGFFLSEIFGC